MALSVAVASLHEHVAEQCGRDRGRSDQTSSFLRSDVCICWIISRCICSGVPPSWKNCAAAGSMPRLPSRANDYGVKAARSCIHEL